MKKQMRKAMLSTMCMLIVGIMCLTGVTYAWFSTSTSAKVTEFEVNVVDAAGGSLLVALGTGTETNNLAFSGQVAAPTLTQGMLTPVSSAGPLSSNTYNPAFFTGTVDGVNITTQAATTEGTHYKKFDLYFRNDGTESIDVILNADYTKVWDGQNATDANTTALATRIAFVTSGSVNYTTDTESNYSNAAPTGAWIYEPNKTTHIAQAYNEHKNLTGQTLSGAVKLPYKAVTQASETAFHRYTGANLTSDDVTTYDISDKHVVTTVNSLSVTKVTVYIWIEGQDADCLNAVAGNPIKTFLGFAIKEPETT